MALVPSKAMPPPGGRGGAHLNGSVLSLLERSVTVELWSFLGSFLRRWRMVVPMMLVSLLAAGALVLTAKPNYQAQGTVVMLLESQLVNANGEPVNPWFSADASASQFASLMVDAVQGPEFIHRMEALGVPETFIIKADETRPAVVSIEVTTGSQEGSLSAYNALRDAFRREVDDRQQALKAPPQTRYSAIDLSVPREPKKVPTRIKLAIAVAALGVVLSLMVAAVAELIATVRRLRLEQELGSPVGRPVGAVPR
jgi:capsular polysaccharide biosynthesis protein